MCRTILFVCKLNTNFDVTLGGSDLSGIQQALLCSSAVADEIDGRVVKVSDGDTITVLDRDHRQIKIRLASIDAPEKKQAFGERSKQHLAGLIFCKDVRIKWHKRDKYGRTIGKVWVAPASRSDCA